METNYFVCTLGQAALLEKEQNYNNVTAFINHQAERVPELNAVGFFHPSTTEEWTSSVLTYNDVLSASKLIAELLSDWLPASIAPGWTVALLCPSSAEFLFTWLALMRLGYPVLLIAPQCTSSAIASLCETCEVSLLLYDDSYEDLATQTKQILGHDGARAFEIHTVPYAERSNLLATIHRGEGAGLPTMPSAGTAAHSQDIGYLHHTSGTSTGTPKHIPQSHRAAVGVLPHLKGSGHATFTTTPLYHGGIADLFRAWTSDAMIWLFPDKKLPITAGNVVHCLGMAEICSRHRTIPPIKYFSSVPYVLQMMASDRRGLQHLQSMDIVGVGGAALPSEVGDDLVCKGVNLVSRFGSAECGFLMSSHRYYDKDKDWQYLRSDYGAENLKFETQTNWLSELVILPGWPHMAKRNREDGSYATADLFQPHPEIPNAWRHHSRADSQLTLITGKKFDPAPLESAIATSPLLDDALIFGIGKPHPGALLFRSQETKNISDAELVASLASNIEKLNANSESHARLPRNMLIPMAFVESPLEKSSKGTIIRREAEKRYSKEIEAAYLQSTLPHGQEVPNEEISNTILHIVESVVGQQGGLTPDTELFSYGVDSIACVQIRYSLMQLLPSDKQKMPLTIVEDCGTVKRVAQYIIARRQGQNLDASNPEHQHQLMWDLVEEYSKFKDAGDGGVRGPNSTESSRSPAEALPKRPHHTDGEVIVLTGATGALGAHILNLYRNSERVSKIYCLVRGADDNVAQERISKALEQRKLLPLKVTLNDNEPSPTEVIVVRAKLAEPALGLSQILYRQIAREATIIMHVAWAVNFRLNLHSFVKDHIAGLTNLINLALISPYASTPKFAFCSSVASVANFDLSAVVPERISGDPASASALGYSRSKWVAELICRRAHENTRLNGNIAVFRVGQLSGDSSTGIWNEKEAYPLMLSSMKITRCLPALKGEPLSWLPVDVAARSFMEGAEHIRDERGDMAVYHIVNDERIVDWMDLLGWLRKREEFEVVEPNVWVERLEDSNEQENPAMKLLDHWKKAYGGNTASASVSGQGDHEEPDKQGKKSPHSRRYAMEKTIEAAPVMRDVQAIDEEYVAKVWRWIKDSM